MTINSYEHQCMVITEQIVILYSRLIREVQNKETESPAQLRLRQQAIDHLLADEAVVPHQVFSGQLREYVKDKYNYPDQLTQFPEIFIDAHS